MLDTERRTVGARQACVRAPGTPSQPQPFATLTIVVDGTVKYWNDDERWGVLVSPDVPGDVWTHFSCIVGTGYRSLIEGDPVRFTAEHYPPGQDGYYWRAMQVVAISEGSEFADLNDEQIERRVNEIHDGLEAEARAAPGAYSIEVRLDVRSIDDGAS
jgi:cold shock protein